MANTVSQNETKVLVVGAKVPYGNTEEIRPHRIGGEGVLIGGQSATLNAQ